MVKALGGREPYVLVGSFRKGGDERLKVLKVRRGSTAVMKRSANTPLDRITVRLSGVSSSKPRQPSNRSKAEFSIDRLSAAQPGPASRTPWTIYGGVDLEHQLRMYAPLLSRPVALLNAKWLVEKAASGGMLAPRQELPPEAFVSVSELKSSCKMTTFLPIIMVSYAWLTPAHPDPRGDHLRYLAVVLSALLESSKAEWGVFWDYGSLFQHLPQQPRTQSEDELFRAGLSMLGLLYSHPWTWVFRLTRFPRGYPASYELPEGASHNVRNYNDRGWCTTESAWSQLSKTRFNCLDLGKIDSESKLVTWQEIREACTVGSRQPPMTASHFKTELESKSFTNGADDRPMVARLYEREYEAHLGQVETLYYDGLGWGDKEIGLLCEVVKSGVFKALKELYLSDNCISSVGVSSLKDAVSDGWLPACRRIHLNGNKRISAAAIETVSTALQEHGAGASADSDSDSEYNNMMVQKGMQQKRAQTPAYFEKTQKEIVCRYMCM